MPMPLAHGLLGASIVAALHPRPLSGRWRVPLLVGALLANAADLDFLLVFTLHSKAWHRGASHSLGFALAVGLLIFWFAGRRRVREAVAYGLAFASHGVLDYLTTTQGRGVELLWPFSTERLMLGLRGLSEAPSRMSAGEILAWLVLEFALFAPLLAALILWRRARKRAG